MVEQPSDEVEDEPTMTRRAFGIGSIVLGTGTFWVNADRSDRETNVLYQADDFVSLHPSVTEKYNVLRGYRVSIAGRFEGEVNNETVTATIEGEKGRILEEKTFTVDRKVFAQPLGRVRRFPDKIAVVRK